MARAHDECPHCGARYRVGRAACPECGSDAETGWKDADEIDYQSIEIPDYYEEPDGRRTRAARLWWFVALLALLAFALVAVLR